MQRTLVELRVPTSLLLAAGPFTQGLYVSEGPREPTPRHCFATHVPSNAVALSLDQNFPGTPPTFTFIVAKFGITKGGSPLSWTPNPLNRLYHPSLVWLAPRAPMGAGVQGGRNGGSWQFDKFNASLTGTQKNDSIEKRKNTAVKISSRKGGEMEARKRVLRVVPVRSVQVQYSVDCLAGRKFPNVSFDQTKAGGLTFVTGDRNYLGDVLFHQCSTLGWQGSADLGLTAMNGLKSWYRYSSTQTDFMLS